MPFALDQRLRSPKHAIAEIAARTDLACRMLGAHHRTERDQRRVHRVAAALRPRTLGTALGIAAALVGLVALTPRLTGLVAPGNQNQYATAMGIIVAHAEQSPPLNRDAVVTEARRQLALQLAQAPRAKEMFLGIPAEQWRVDEVRQLRQATDVKPLEAGVARGGEFRLDPPRDVWVVTLSAERTVDSTRPEKGVPQPYRRRVPLAARFIFESQARDGRFDPLRSDFSGAPVKD